MEPVKKKNRNRRLAIVLLIGMGICCGPVPASSVSGASEDLVEMARAARTKFSPIPADRLDRAHAEVKQAVEGLDAFLGQGSDDNAERWKTYLHWQEMLDALSQKGGPDPSRLGAITVIYYHNQPGLELTAFTDLRDALVVYLNQLAIANDPKLEATYQSRIDKLIELLNAYAGQPDTALRQQIGQTVGWLEQAGQATELVAAIRQQYQNPNLYATISARLAAAGFRRTIDKQTGVSDCILGTSINGTADFQGQTDLEMVDDPDGATLQLRVRGQVRSVNSGQNRGVTILSTGMTSVDAYKQIFLRADSLSSIDAVAQCCTSTQITGICAKSCLIEKIARKRAGRSKHQAESIASRHAEARVAVQVDAEADDLLQQASENYQEKFRKLLLRRGQFPEILSFRTMADRLRVVWQQADASQLAAPKLPPAVSGTPDLAVRLHESFVSNFSRALIGGFTLTDERVAKMLEDTTGQVPDELKIGPDKEPWSITFSSTDPVSVVFSDDSIRFAIRGRRFTSGGQVIPNTLELSAVYKLEKTPTGAHLTRQGDVSVDYVGKTGKLNYKLTAARTVMKRKFEALFAAEFVTDGIKLPGRWQQGGKLHLDQLATKNGWLTIGWLAPGVDSTKTITADQVASAE